MDYSLITGFCRRFAWQSEPVLVGEVGFKPDTMAVRLPFATAAITPTTTKRNGRWLAKAICSRQECYWEESPIVTGEVYGFGHFVLVTMTKFRRYNITPTAQLGLSIFYRHQEERQKTWYNYRTKQTTPKPPHKVEKGWWCAIQMWEFTPGEYWSPLEICGFERAENPILFDEAVKVLRGDEHAVWGAWLDQAMHGNYRFSDAVKAEFGKHL